VGLLLLAALVVGALWATAPLRRKHELARAALPLVPGAAVSVEFEPEERGGPFVVALRFAREAPVARIGALVAGGWREPGPAGLELSYTVRNGARAPVEGATGTVLPALDHAYGRAEPGFVLAFVGEGLAEPSAARVRVERAVEGLAGTAAAVVVEPVGDWEAYAWFEALARAAVVVLAFAAVCVPVCVVFAVRLWRKVRAQRDTAQAPQGGG
jgi:hypothetical protein